MEGDSFQTPYKGDGSTLEDGGSGGRDSGHPSLPLPLTSNPKVTTTRGTGRFHPVFEYGGLHDGDEVEVDSPDTVDLETGTPAKRYVELEQLLDSPEELEDLVTLLRQLKKEKHPGRSGKIKGGDRRLLAVENARRFSVGGITSAPHGDGGVEAGLRANFVEPLVVSVNNTIQRPILKDVDEVSLRRFREQYIHYVHHCKALGAAPAPMLAGVSQRQLEAIVVWVEITSGDQVTESDITDSLIDRLLDDCQPRKAIHDRVAEFLSMDHGEYRHIATTATKSWFAKYVTFTAYVKNLLEFLDLSPVELSQELDRNPRLLRVTTELLWDPLQPEPFKHWLHKTAESRKHSGKRVNIADVFILRTSFEDLQSLLSTMEHAFSSPSDRRTGPSSRSGSTNLGVSSRDPRTRARPLRSEDRDRPRHTGDRDKPRPTQHRNKGGGKTRSKTPREPKELDSNTTCDICGKTGHPAVINVDGKVVKNCPKFIPKDEFTSVYGPIAEKARKRWGLQNPHEKGDPTTSKKVNQISKIRVDQHEVPAKRPDTRDLESIVLTGVDANGNTVMQVLPARAAKVERVVTSTDEMTKPKVILIPGTTANHEVPLASRTGYVCPNMVGDSGSELNVLPFQHFQDLRRKFPDLEVKSVDGLHISMADGKGSHKIEHSVQVHLFIPSAFAFGNGLSLLNVTFFIPNATYRGEDILLGSPLMHATGYEDFLRFLERKATTNGRMDLGKTNQITSATLGQVRMVGVATTRSESLGTPSTTWFSGTGEHKDPILDPISIDIMEKPATRADLDAHLDRIVATALENGLPTNLAESARDLLHRFRDVFVTGILPDDHGIKVKPWRDIVKPPAQRASLQYAQRRYSPEQTKLLSKLADHLITTGLCSKWDGIIDDDVSTVGYAPIMLVKKSSNKYRMVVDLRRSNTLVEPTPCFTPTFDQIELILGGKQYYFSADLKSWFWQVPWHRTSAMTSIVVFPDGRQLRSNYMLQGFINSTPSTNRAAQVIFEPQLMNREIGIVVDDIVAAGDSPERVLDIVEGVLERCQMFNAKMNVKKFVLLTTRVKFLGKIYVNGTSFINPERVSALTNMRPPRDAAELGNFIGSINWISQHLPGVQPHLRALVNLKTEVLKRFERKDRLTSRKVSLHDQWTSSHQAAFDAIRSIVGKDIARYIPTDDDLILLVSDASDTGWSGAVLAARKGTDLSQPLLEMPNLRLVSWLAGTWSGAERAYDTPQQEVLAALRLLEKSEMYLHRPGGAYLYTDHSNMVSVMVRKHDPETSSVFSSRITRWAVRASMYPVTIIHVPGYQNLLADLGSRLVTTGHLTPPVAQRVSVVKAILDDTQEDQFDVDDEDVPVEFVVNGRAYVYGNGLAPARIDPRNIIHGPRTRRGRRVFPDNQISKGGDGVGENDQKENENTNDDLMETSDVESNGSDENVGGAKQDHDVDGDEITNQMLRQRDYGIDHIKLEQHNPLPSMEEIAKAQHESLDVVEQYEVKQGVFYYKEKIVVPDDKQLKWRIILAYHVQYHVHQSATETKRRLSQSPFWWKGMDTEIDDYISTCLNCQRDAGQSLVPRIFAPTFVPTKIGEFLFMDFVKVHDLGNELYPYCLVVKDGFTKLVWFWPAKRANLQVTISALMQWIAIYGFPLNLVTDGGSHFTNTIVKRTCELLGITRKLSVPNASWTNGFAESAVKDFRKVIRSLLEGLTLELSKWRFIAPNLMLALNNLPRRSLGGFSPFALWFGRGIDDALRRVVSVDQDQGKVLELDPEIFGKAVRELQLILDDSHARAFAASEKARETGRTYLNKGLSSLDLNVGEFVLVLSPSLDARGKSIYRWRGPSMIVDVKGSSEYEVKDLVTEKVSTVHAQRLRLFREEGFQLTEDIKRSLLYQRYSYSISNIVGHRKRGNNYDLEVVFYGFDDDPNSNSFEPLSALVKQAKAKVRKYVRGLLTSSDPAIRRDGRSIARLSGLVL